MNEVRAARDWTITWVVDATPPYCFVTQPGVIYNKRTGQLAPQTQTAAKPAQNFEAGKVYTDAKGNRARWDGKQFVPA